MATATLSSVLVSVFQLTVEKLLLTPDASDNHTAQHRKRTSLELSSNGPKYTSLSSTFKYDCENVSFYGPFRFQALKFTFLSSGLVTVRFSVE